MYTFSIDVELDGNYTETFWTVANDFTEAMKKAEAYYGEDMFAVSRMDCFDSCAITTTGELSEHMKEYFKNH